MDQIQWKSHDIATLNTGQWRYHTKNKCRKGPGKCKQQGRQALKIPTESKGSELE